MTTTELTILGLLVVIAGQTTYTTYRTWRGSAQQRNDAIFVDTSVLMDGRIVSIAQAGFIPGRLVIPRSVIGELQFLADHADSDRRSRARQGLDVVNELQAMDGVDVELLQDGTKAAEGVDERLLSLAKKYGGKICTIDFNLNKVAQVEDIAILNINELAKNLRMVYLPGDTVTLELTTTGSDSHQAVGHLDDGTMVVVEQARRLIGKSTDVEIVRSLQTAAGRMMFAKLVKPKKVDLTKESAERPAAQAALPTKPTTTRSTTPKTKSSSAEKSTKSSASSRKSKTKTKAVRKTPKRRNNEDRLIALVDSQKD